MTSAVTDNQLRRIGLIGFGYRGKYLWQLLNMMPQCRVVGIADPALCLTDSLDNVALYNQGAEDYKRMIDTERPDLVVIASPWGEQIPQAEYCVEQDIPVGLEIRGGTELESYDHLLQLSQSRDIRVYPLENTVFMREIMAVWHMTQLGILGDIVYMRGGYRHDLRHLLVNEQGVLGGEGSSAAWRAHYYTKYCADIYPTHGFAPLALIAGLRQPEDIAYLDAQCSQSLGLAEYIARRGGIAPQSLMPDIITTQLAMTSGTLIHLTHDTTLPRPKSLDYEIQGTRGVWHGDRRSIYLEGVSPEGEWEDDAAYIERYEHPLWRRWGAEALKHDQHHAGMDYLMLRTMIQDRIEPGLFLSRIEDLALWSSITARSSAAIARHRPPHP